MMYRFHPSVQWTRGYPNKDQIVEQVTDLWKRYGLDSRTTFNTSVDKVSQDKEGRRIVNSKSNGYFDGVIAAVGTCGDPRTLRITNQHAFKGDVYHSSQLTGKEARGKNVAIIGGGASAVEALEFATNSHAEHTTILARATNGSFRVTPLSTCSSHLTFWARRLSSASSLNSCSAASSSVTSRISSRPTKVSSRERRWLTPTCST
jgi:cation diffusion facilitator CzcD-associated flavoprotein CzcO